MIAFKRKFYVVDSTGWGHVFAIEPSLKVTEITSIKGTHKSFRENLVKSEELVLVQWFNPKRPYGDIMNTWFRVFRLDVEGETRKWVQVNDLNDRVIFFGRLSLCCSTQKLPGANDNCIVFMYMYNNESIFVYDLRTRRTVRLLVNSKAMGPFGTNLKSLVWLVEL